MRLLHTSDWHLGQTFHQFERTGEHQRFLDWLLATLEAEAIDALLIAGDIFDTANPSAAAQSMLYRFLTEAHRRQPDLDIVLTAGNHDSPGRLEAPAPLLSLFNAKVVGLVKREAPESALEDLVHPLRNRDGQISAWCIAMPFLRPADVPRVDTENDACMGGVAALYRQAFELAKARQTPGQAIIAMGHCHMTGCETSDESERRIVIGGAEALSASIFDDAIAYVALGHLHLPQKIKGNATRRYSGSPLPMSFSEIHYPHQVLVVDLEGETVAGVREIRVPRSVDLIRVPTTPRPLAEVLAALSALELPDRPEAEWPYLQVRVQLTQPEPGLRTQIDAALTGKPIRLARIETSFPKNPDRAASPMISIDELNALAPADFFEKLYQHRYDEAPPPELMRAFNELTDPTLNEGQHA